MTESLPLKTCRIFREGDQDEHAKGVEGIEWWIVLLLEWVMSVLLWVEGCTGHHYFDCASMSLALYDPSHKKKRGEIQHKHYCFDRILKWI